LKNVGLIDPFPEEEVAIESPGELPKEVDGVLPDVYADTRYVYGNSPYCLYIPNRDIMFKLMRACVKVEDAEELWF